MNISIRRLVLVLTPLVIALAFAMDIYVPAIPTIAIKLHVSADKMQQTLTWFMFTAGLMQLIVGPLSDQFGRKKLSILMIAIFCLGTLLCSTASTLPQLIGYRILQSIGCCGMLVVAYAIVRDIFHGVESAKVYSYLGSMIAFSPMFAPYIGSYVDIKYGWPSTFLALLVLGFLSFLAVTLGITESLPKEKRIKFDTKIFRTYFNIAHNKTFSIYTFFTATGLSYLYLFCSTSPYIIIKELNIPELNYGYYFMFMGISFFIGSIISAYIVGKFGVYKTVLLGFFLSLIGGITMLTWYLIVGLTITGFVWPMLLIGIGGTFAMGAGNGGAMEPFGEQSGAASALGGAIRFMFASLIGTLVIGERVTSTLPLALPAIVFSIMGIIIFPMYKSILELAEE